MPQLRANPSMNEGSIDTPGQDILELGAFRWAISLRRGKARNSFNND
jgi:hypothetical protein